MLAASFPAPGFAHVCAETDTTFDNVSVGDFLRDAVARVPDQIALVAASSNLERRWTYRELLADVERVAQALLTHFQTGDRVATWAGGSPETLLLTLGSELAGIVLVTLNPANRATELEYLLAQSQVRGLFLDRYWRKLDNQAVIEPMRERLPHLEALVYLDQWTDFTASARPCMLPSVLHDSPALILFTSGTTGKPKGAVLRHDGIVNNARLTNLRAALPPNSVWLNLLPMFHVGGSVTMTLGCIANLGTQILLPEFSAEGMLDALERYGVGMTMAVPTMLYAMLQSERFSGADLSKLEVVVTGGTTVPPELVREVKNRTGAEIMSMIGQTEASGSMCMTRRGDSVEQVSGSAGTPIALSEARIVGIDGATLKLNEIGEIFVRTPCAMVEYFGMPEKTRETLDVEGWLHTGDIGLMRPDGYVQVTGRLKEMIIRGGENIYPREIEDQLAEHPDVAQSAVFGVPDEKWGEQVAAAVIVRPGREVTSEALTDFLQARIAKFKVPRHWYFVETFPVNASGKIQKFLLRHQLTGH